MYSQSRGRSRDVNPENTNIANQWYTNTGSRQILKHKPCLAKSLRSVSGGQRNVKTKRNAFAFTAITLTCHVSVGRSAFDFSASVASTAFPGNSLVNRHRLFQVRHSGPERQECTIANLLIRHAIAGWSCSKSLSFAFPFSLRRAGVCQEALWQPIVANPSH